MTPIAVSVDAATDPLFLVHLLALVAVVFVLRFAWQHSDHEPGKWFAIWITANVCWLGFHTLGLVVLSPRLRQVVDSLELAAIPVSGACWIVFTLVYSGRWESLRKRPGVVLAAPTGLLVALLLTNPIHGRVHTVAETTVAFGVVVTEEAGPTSQYIWLTLAFVYALYLLGIVVVLELLARDELFRDQAGALLVSVLVPLAVAATLMSNRATIQFDMTPLSFGLTSMLLAYAVFRSELLSMMPASYRLGERTAMETVDQGVVVQDPNGRVVLTNPAAEGILGSDAHRIVGSRFDDVLRDSPLEPRRRLTTTNLGASESATTQPMSDGGHTVDEDDRTLETLHDARTGRTYEVHQSTIDEVDGPELGQTLFFRDVTDERRRKERLLVLNRIVRHNLRNDMNVLRGHVELIQEQIDHPSADVVGDIATDLVRLGEKAHQMDRIIGDSTVEETPVNVAGVVEHVVDRQRAGTPVPIDVRGARQAWTETSAPLVRATLSNLVENAVERSADVADADAADAGVVVDVTTDGDEVTVAVTDQGAEIPETEVATLVSGEVSALQHSSGIGLWTVRWCVDIADADWEIDSGEQTTISVTFDGEPELQTEATGAP